MPSAPKICVNMIVKDEAAIIESCLRSLLSVADHFVICDTGSTDETPALIESVFSRNNVRGELHRIPFVDFEVTRNRALDLCRASALDFDFILLVDADMELVVEDAGFKNRLTDNVYSIRQVNVISYYNTRLLHRSCAARYVGVTHEYLSTPTPAKRLPGVWFNDRACGSSRATKFERDIRLLTEDLRRDPANCRSMFYLAQSYKDSGRFEEAIDWYHRRVAVGGWAEEVWYSLYMIALCHDQLGNDAEMIEFCLLAFAHRPSRIESLWSLARFYRGKLDFNSCMAVCAHAQGIPYPESDSLFIQDFVYKTGIWEEMSLAGFYCDAASDKENGYEATVRLTTDRDADEGLRHRSLANHYYYVKSAEELFSDFSIKPIAVPTEAPYSPSNPSIWIDAAGIRCIVRSVNYRVDDMVYTVLEPDRIVRTQNFIVQLDENFDVRECHLMRDCSTGVPQFPSCITGYEDCRLFFCRGQYWCTATVCDRSPTLLCEIALLRLDDQFNVVDVDVIRDINPDRHQKNWAPLVRDDELYLIYTNDPTVILKYDFERRRAEVVYYGVPDACLENFRGGSQAIRHRDAWIYLTHEVCYVTSSLRFYQHRFVSLTDDFRVAGFTEPFYFMHKGIEFASGLAFDGRQRKFVASFGVNDRQAYLAFFDEESVIARIRKMSTGDDGISLALRPLTLAAA